MKFWDKFNKFINEPSNDRKNENGLKIEVDNKCKEKKLELLSKTKVDAINITQENLQLKLQETKK